MTNTWISLFVAIVMIYAVEVKWVVTSHTWLRTQYFKTRFVVPQWDDRLVYQDQKISALIEIE